jgi:hypothetical protein
VSLSLSLVITSTVIHAERTALNAPDFRPLIRTKEALLTEIVQTLSTNSHSRPKKMPWEKAEKKEKRSSVPKETKKKSENSLQTPSLEESRLYTTAKVEKGMPRSPSAVGSRENYQKEQKMEQRRSKIIEELDLDALKVTDPQNYNM